MRPAPMIHHQDSPTWNLTTSPASRAIAAKARPTACKYPIAPECAGDSNAEGGSQPVSAGSPFSARCFQSFQQCSFNNSQESEKITPRPSAFARAAKSRCHAAQGALTVPPVRLTYSQSEEHPFERHSLMHHSYAVLYLEKKNTHMQPKQ